MAFPPQHTRHFARHVNCECYTLERHMFGYRFLRSAAIALEAYGVLGIFISVAMLVVGHSTFDNVASLQRTLESERMALVNAIQTASATLRDTAGASTEFEGSVGNARNASDQASTLANNSAGTFRDLGSAMRSVSLFGIQPLAGLGPQFDRSADELQQLAISLGATREALGQNAADVRRVGTDLTRLQSQLEEVAATLAQPGVLSLGAQSLLPFQMAFYGMCLMVIVQSAFSIVAGLALHRLARALGTGTLFPALGRPGLPSPAHASGSEAEERLSLVR
jgi:hypothetical protein